MVVVVVVVGAAVVVVVVVVVVVGAAVVVVVVVVVGVGILINKSPMGVPNEKSLLNVINAPHPPEALTALNCKVCPLLIVNVVPLNVLTQVPLLIRLCNVPLPLNAPNST